MLLKDQCKSAFICVRLQFLGDIVMDLLCRLGGLTGTETGETMGVDYSTVSQGGNRLREKRKRDKNLSALLGKTEADLS